MVETATGDLTPAYEFDAMAVLRGADLLAKHVGLYERNNNQKRLDLGGDPRSVLEVLISKLNKLIVRMGQPRHQEKIVVSYDLDTKAHGQELVDALIIGLHGLKKP
ncbi:hypothetical protein [Desulfurivibrio dismutans]|uniref:hypothetical protein n=1 Tax=Desulfurivibrio dismutans TaxID=1398908 RepID=UPI0023DAB8E6|nr:hypothetical protein [Desulfurivibrio alkaliphilus]MDF1613844.1 hypothetical protein [Desulfurivibrio alkaliphilus]